MFCTNCGTQLPDEAKFCSNCGKPTHGTASGSGNSNQTDLPQQERTNQPATGTSVDVEPGSLEGAVREAQARDILRLKAGEHRLSHPLEIHKPLSLIGEGMDNTRVLCDGEGHVVKLVGDGPFVLHDLSFEHEGSLWANVVEVIAGGEIDIRRCRFTGGVRDKEKGYRSSDGSGLCLRRRTRGLVANCESVQNGESGIYVDEQSQPTLEANVCKDNDWGITYGGSAAGTAHQNTCSAKGGSGIHVKDQAQPTLEANSCQENKGIGIAYSDDAAGTARQNTCSANGSAGIFVDDHAQPALEANSCQENRSFGISYLRSAAGTARQNTCSANGSAGISVQVQAHPTLEANTCQENKKDGILYWQDAAGSALKNTCSANEYSGIGVGNQAHPTLEANACSANEHSGILVTDQAQPTLGANTCNANKKHGIVVLDDARPTLEANTCQDNKQYGIFYASNVAGVVRHNVCFLNGMDDLYVYPDSHPILEGNRTGAPPAQTGAQPERIPAAGTEKAWITAEKEYAGFGAGLLASLLPGRPDPFNITLTVIVSGPPGTGSVEVMKHRFPTLSRTPLEYMQSDEIGEGNQVLEQMTAELTNAGFQLVEYGPFWFQRRFEREYRPGDIDYS